MQNEEQKYSIMYLMLTFLSVSNSIHFILICNKLEYFIYLSNRMKSIKIYSIHYLSTVSLIKTEYIILDSLSTIKLESL